MLEKILAALKALKIIPEDKIEEVKTELVKLELDKKNEPAPADTSKITDPAIKEMFDGLNGQVKALIETNKQLQAALTEEKTQRDAGIKAQQDNAKKVQEEKIKKAVNEAIAAGKYPEAKRESLTKQFEAAYEATEIVVSGAPVQKQFIDAANKGGKDTGSNKTSTSARSPLDSAPVTILKAIKEMDSQPQP